MRVEFSRYTDTHLTAIVTGGDYHHGQFNMDDAIITGKRHEGIWNSRNLRFEPLPLLTVSDSMYPPYNDNSGAYFEECAVCGCRAGGNRYCGPSCEQMDTEGGL